MIELSRISRSAFHERRSVAISAEGDAAQWPLGDPVDRLKNHLIAIGEWSDARQRAMESELTDMVNASWQEAITYGTMTEAPTLDRDLMFEDVFKEVPPHLKKQREQMKALLPKGEKR